MNTTTTTLHRWFITDDRGRSHQTRYLMSEADALATDPTAEAVPGSMEIRHRPACTITCGAAHLGASAGATAAAPAGPPPSTRAGRR